MPAKARAAVAALGCLVATVTSPALATDTGTSTEDAAAKERADNRELKKSIDDLREAVDRLSEKVSGRANGEAEDATKWMQDKADQVGKALQDAGDKLNGKTDEAQTRARDELASALKSLGKTLDGLASKVQGAGGTGTANGTGTGTDH